MLLSIDADSSARCNETGASGGYSDIQIGAQVVIRDSAGTIVATGSLLPGTATEDNRRCDYPFVVEDVPTSDFYSIEVSHRGELTYSHEELEDRDWEVMLSLGD
jgi:hypothetical protein